MLGGGILRINRQRIKWVKVACFWTIWQEFSFFFVYLKDLLGSLLHARPHLVAETPQRVKLQDGVDALAGLLVMELGHHHFGHCVGDLYSTQEEHGSWRGFREDEAGGMKGE